MIANTPHDHFASVEVLEELAKEELGRFKRSIAKASHAYFDEQSKGLEPKEAKDLWNKITRAVQVITYGVDDAYDTAFTLLKDPDHERKAWDTYLTGARTLTRTTPFGYAFGLVAKTLKLEETVNMVSSLIARSTEVQGDIHVVARKAKEFVDHYEWAKQQAKSFGSEDEGLIRKYASLKTWERKEEFVQFSSVAEKATAGGIEVFIEGPVKLYLMISSGQLMLVIQGLVRSSAFDFENAGTKGLDDSLTILQNAQKAVETSLLFKIMRELFATGLREYHASWEEEHLEFRQPPLDEDRAQRFVECFENGSLFVK
ncbi:MAG: hypothetical protein WCT49_04330 [Candidatus Paceibacterota bacterium]|jgi:rubrerythrin|nr:hypothetical protein [Candidatus Paceibacterota bacterium]